MFTQGNANEGDITTMKSKNVVKLLTFLAVLSIVTFWGNQVNSQTVNTFIEAIENRSPGPDTTPEEYDGPQTVKALMNAFDEAYNQKYSKARVMALCEGGVVYSGELEISGEIDARYSRVEWLQMLLQRGITIEDFDDYRIYLSKRHTLAFLEDNPDLQEIGFLGIPLTDDQEAYKVAYIDKLVHNRVQKASKQIERLTARIERYNKQLEQAKKQSNSKQLKQAQAKLENAEKQLEDARKRLKGIQEALERPKNRNMKKRSPYPPL
ncbi:hypothetical protein C6499_03925 [Candidatus Poribacteria bacterium]|nr:MAG: hypothetical protein C6499_03925 [Candidatus Poribacteria bacterium]